MPTMLYFICDECHGVFLRPQGKSKIRRHVFCSVECLRAYKSDSIARFWEKVCIGKDADCWTWEGATSERGYGVFTVRHHGTKKRNIGAHVFSYTLRHGSVPDGLFVLHQCDNPPCVNSNHLWAGTHLENIQDAVRKGRMASGDRHYRRKDPARSRGENNYMAILTPQKVVYARQLILEGWTHQRVADLLCVSRQAISMLNSRKTWSHV